MLDLYKTFARYNRWANATLYAACDRLGDGAYYADRRAFFGSIHNTLNHLVVTDRIWLARIEGRPNPPYALNDVPYAGRAELRAARAAEDDRLIAVVEAIDPARLANDLSYATTAGEPQRTPLHLVLSHLFNHQTHHRAQVHDMLSQAGIKPPPLDLLAFIRLQPRAAASG
jgi:uncharacterized damage-inducible protein DinB